NIFSANWLSLGSGTCGEGALTNEHIFKYQSDVIEMLSQKGGCIIVGRCADYILRHYPHCINIFLHAPLKERIHRVVERDKIKEKDAAIIIQKRDKQRATYYNFYTDKQWGDSNSYHLTIDSSILGISETAELIYQFIIKYRATMLP
ncbi:MAG: cytidylate kinase-like family protein, partial [Bacteroidales bacterium]